MRQSLFNLKRILGLKRAVGESTASEASRPDTGLPGGGRQSQPRSNVKTSFFSAGLFHMKREVWFVIGMKKGTISIKSKKIVPFLRKNRTKNDNYQKIVPIRSGQSH